MLTSVFLKTVRDMRWQILGWGTGLAAMAGVNVLVFPSFQGMSEMESFIEMLPEALRKLIGDTSFSVLEEFLRMKLFDSWLPIILGVFAIVHSAAAIAGEEERGSMDLLMANPIERWRIVLEKFAAVAFAVIVMSALTCVGLVAGILVSGVETRMGPILWATFNVVPITLVFGALALAGSCLFHRPRHAVAVSVVVLVVSYFIYTLAPLSEAIEPWVGVSLFYYYSKTEPFGAGVRFEFVALLFGVMGIVLAGAVAAFRRKDLAV